jgi:6,7-dimethyl-8-ribityllumazine synthase
VVREIARKKKAEAIIALGVIIEGETDHARLLGEVVTQSLQQIALEYGVPVIHAVQSLKNEEQARERCLGDKINRGTEAARAALEMTNLLAEIRS